MEQQDFSSRLVQSAIDIVTPVIENATILAAQYAKACGRDIVLSKDVEYCMKYCTMHTAGKHLGSQYPEVYDSEDSDIVVDEDEDVQFEPYSGSDADMRAITEAYNTWDSWVPTNPSEQILKNAIDSNGQLSGGLD